MPLPPSIGTDLGGPNAKDGATDNPNAAAVTGFNSGNQTAGFIAGPDPIFKRPTGVFARSPNTGVFGFGEPVIVSVLLGTLPTESGPGSLGTRALGGLGYRATAIAQEPRYWALAVALERLEDSKATSR